MPQHQLHVETERIDARLARLGAASGRPVLLVPGLGATPLAFQLGGRRSLAQTLRDHGATPWVVDFHVHWRSKGQDATALLRALELSLAEICRATGCKLSQVDAIGHSLGGILLLALAVEGVSPRRLVTLASGLDYRLGHAALPRALSLSPKGIGPLRIGARRGGLPVRRIARLAAPVMGRGLSLPIQRDQFHPGSTPGPVIRQMMKDGVRDMPLALLLDLADLFSAKGLHLGRGSQPLKDAVANIGLPVLMVAGRQDRQCPLDAVRDAARRIPGARLLEVGGQGRPGQGYGHVDLMTATKAPLDVFAPLMEFLDLQETRVQLAQESA